MENLDFIYGIVALIFAINIFRFIYRVKNNLGHLEFNQDLFKNKQEKGLILDELGQLVQRKELDKIMNLFFENKVIDINKRYNTGDTPLSLAVKSGDATIVKYLLDKGAQIEVQDNQGNSPLSLAQKFGHKDMESFLLAALKKKKAF